MEFKEQIQRILENVPKVYEAGSSSIKNEVSNALKGSASGEIVALKDVSPLEHILGVRVSGENIADIEAVKVAARGKNLFNIPTLVSTPEKGEKIFLPVNNNPWIKSATYTLSADVTRFEDDTAEYTFFDFNAVYTDGTVTMGRIFIAYPDDAASFRDGKPRHYTTTIVCDNTKQLDCLVIHPLSCSDDTSNRSSKAENIQLEIGTETEYEPYIEPVEYAVNADGTVEGVKSIYPSTTLTTDTEGVLIEVEYNKDINKAFAELQQAIISLGGNV